MRSVQVIRLRPELRPKVAIGWTTTTCYTMALGMRGLTTTPPQHSEHGPTVFIAFRRRSEAVLCIKHFNVYSDPVRCPIKRHLHVEASS